jgi:hypothetical protein
LVADVVVVSAVGVAVASVEVAEVDLVVAVEVEGVIEVVVEVASVDVGVQVQEELLKSNSKEHAKCYERYKNFYCFVPFNRKFLNLSFII